MPYIAPEHRVELDPHIQELVKEAGALVRQEDLRRLFPVIMRVAHAIREIENRRGEYGDFAGPLNYAITEFFLSMMPEIRYRVCAKMAGTIRRLVHLFTSTPLSDVEAVHEQTRGDVPFGTNRAWIRIAEWVIVRLAVYSAPDKSRDAADYVIGVLNHIDLEFYRRVGHAYEDMQIAKNGDCKSYQKLQRMLEEKSS